MIKKFNEYLNEKLSDKLHGYTKEELIENADKIYNDIIQHIDDIKDETMVWNMFEKLKPFINFIQHEKIFNLLYTGFKKKLMYKEDIFQFNEFFNLKLTKNELIKFFGYDESFDTVDDFLEFIFTKCEKIQNDDYIIIKYKNETLVEIDLLNYNVNISYDKIKNVLYYVFGYKKLYKNSEYITLKIKEGITKYLKINYIDVEYF